MTSSNTAAASGFRLMAEKPKDTTPPMESPSLLKDPLMRKEKMNSFKRSLAANRLRNDDAIRRKMELLKEQRSLSTLTKSDIQKEMEAAAKSRIEEELGRPVSSKEWPFVYFVVTLDQVPQVAEDGAQERSARSSQTARERQRFLATRRRKIQETREETERIREAGIDMGLRLEPIKPTQQPEQHAIQRMRTRPSMSRHPPTPVSSVGSKPDFSFLNSHDDLSEVELTRRSINMLISDTISQAGMCPKGSNAPVLVPTSNLELPQISASMRRKALGTGPSTGSTAVPFARNGDRKVVTFAETLPVIKGNGIPVVGVKPVVDSVSSSSPNTNARHSDQSGRAEEEEGRGGGGEGEGGGGGEEGGDGSKKNPNAESTVLRPPWSAPLTTRSLNSMTPRSRLYEPMALPKIDIVSEIYDELIVKTIQKYLMAEGYSQEKIQQLRQTVLSRLSSTYPHLVKHKAWHPDPLAADAADFDDERANEEPFDDYVDKARLRSRSQLSRFGRNSCDRTPLFESRARPFTTPGQVQDTVYGQKVSFMSIDGQTMTITPRNDPRFRPAILPGSQNSNQRQLPVMSEAEAEEAVDRQVRPAGEPKQSFVIPGGGNDE